MTSIATFKGVVSFKMSMNSAIADLSINSHSFAVQYTEFSTGSRYVYNVEYGSEVWKCSIV